MTPLPRVLTRYEVALFGNRFVVHAIRGDMRPVRVTPSLATQAEAEATVARLSALEVRQARLRESA